MARSKEKSPEASAPKFVGALKVVPKLVASDQKIGRLWMLATVPRFLGLYQVKAGVRSKE